MRRDNQGENPSRRRFAFEAKLSGVLEHDRRIPVDVPADLQTGARIAKELVQRCLVRLNRLAEQIAALTAGCGPPPSHVSIYRRASCALSSHSRRAAPSSRALRLGTASRQSTK